MGVKDKTCSITRRHYCEPHLHRRNFIVSAVLSTEIIVYSVNERNESIQSEPEQSLMDQSVV